MHPRIDEIVVEAAPPLAIEIKVNQWGKKDS